MTEVDFAYFNFEHGGLIGGEDRFYSPAGATSSTVRYGLLVIRAAGRTLRSRVKATGAPDMKALDYLIGWWDQTRRCRPGGIEFFDVAEMASDYTPTQIRAHNGRQRRTIDRLIVNKPWAEAIVPGSYKVHQPGDPDHPGSDHLPVSVTVHV